MKAGVGRAAFDAAAVPGMAVAVVRDGEVRMEAFGRRSAAATSPVGPSTVFDAASLTKPLVAYVVMQLADAGALDLDDLVAAHAPFALADEIAAAPITVEHLLSHRSGLPNLFDTGLLRVHVPPGRRFSYSSVGYAYLQRAIEAVTGEPLEATVRRRVLEPLGMRDSSLIWQRRFEANHAVPHEGGVPLDKHRPPVASASYSLQTTAGDYARFVAATIAGTGLSEAAHTRWLAPCVAVPDGRAEDLSEDGVPAATGLAWSLGWGREPEAGTFFQWGKTAGVRTFAMGTVGARTGIVVLANGNTGLRAIGPLVDEVLPRDHPAVGWLYTCVTE
jgi:CubicO group peptidase (beta-lactamase class C family)